MFFKCDDVKCFWNEFVHFFKDFMPSQMLELENVFFVPPFIDICLVLYAWNENTSMLWSDKALLTKYKLSFVEIHA